MGRFSDFGLSGTGDAFASDYQAIRNGNVMDGGERDDIQPVNGWLQDTIDYAAEAQELEDGMLDNEFWARGQF